MSDRLFEYFVVVGHGSSLVRIQDDHNNSINNSHIQNNNNNNTNNNSNANIHKSFIDYSYQAMVIDRYPTVDSASIPFPPGISMFCLPNDVTLSRSPPLPILHYFAATQANGIRLYGTCLRFHEPLDNSILTNLLNNQDQLLEDSLNSISNKHDNHNNNVSNQPSEEDNLLMKIEKENVRRLINQKLFNGNDMNHNLNNLSLSNLPPLTPKHTRSRPQALSLSLNEGSGPQGPHSPYLSPVHTNSSTGTSFSSGPTGGTGANGGGGGSMDLMPPLNRARTVSAFVPQKLRTVYSSKCICILSTHPFLHQFRTFLTELYRRSLTPSSIPLERLISHLFLVDLPPFGELKICYSLNDKINIEFARPPLNRPLAFTHFDITLLFKCLDIENVIRLFESVLLERRVLLISTRFSLLTIVTETLCRLIFPFQYSHVYIPLLPKSLFEFLYAPLPFIIACHTSYMKTHLTHDMKDDLIIVDLDNNTFAYGTQSLPCLPLKQRRKLIKALKPLALFTDPKSRTEAEQRLFNEIDLAFVNAPPPDEIQYHKNNEKDKDDDPEITDKSIIISNSFFRVFVSLFADYRSYLIYPSNQNNHSNSNLNELNDECFDKEKFLNDHVKKNDDEQHFLPEFLNTQGFQRFVEERIFPQANTKAYVRFFDESIIQKRNRSKFKKHVDTPFLNAHQYDIVKTLFVQPPITTDLDKSTFVYSTFPPLNEKYFLDPSAGSGTQRSTFYVTTTASITSSDSSVHSTLNRFSVSSQSTSNLSTVNDGSTPKNNNKNNNNTNPNAGTNGSNYKNGRNDRRNSLSRSNASPAQLVHTIFFLIYFTLEVRPGLPNDIKNSVLDTAFQILSRMKSLSIQPEVIVFKSFMTACGEAGALDKAVKVIQEMESFGFDGDASIYETLLQAFSVNGDHKGYQALINLKNIPNHHATLNSKTIGASSSPLNNPNNANTNPSGTSNPPGRRRSGSVSKSISGPHNSATVQSQNTPDPVKRNLSPNVLSGLAGSNENDESYYSHCLARFEKALPHLSIDTCDTCPECNVRLSDQNIRDGWTNNPQDYTTKCFNCNERFVARFQLKPKKINSPENEATGPGAGGGASVKIPFKGDFFNIKLPVSYEYLCPHVVKKEVLRLIDQSNRDNSVYVSKSNNSSSHTKKTLTNLNITKNTMNDNNESKNDEGSHNVNSNSNNLPVPLSKPPLPARRKMFRVTSPALVFNLIWYFSSYELPVQFLVSYFDSISTPTPTGPSPNTVAAHPTISINTRV